MNMVSRSSTTGLLPWKVSRFRQSDNKLGVHLGQFIARNRVHIVAMTGSYFRGDAEAVLTAGRGEIRQRHLYLPEQLNGYEYKALDIGYFSIAALMSMTSQGARPAEKPSCIFRTLIRAEHEGQDQGVEHIIEHWVVARD